MPAGTRGQAEVLADAIRILTEAARLRRPVHRQAADGGWEPGPVRTEPADWAEFVTLALAGAAANVGSVDRALEGRPGSWEADAVRGLLESTVGYNDEHLMGHRTEPIKVVLRPAEILADLGYTVLYEDSRRVLQEQQDRHLWHYMLGSDHAWTPLDPGAPPWADAFNIPGQEPGAWGGRGTIMTVPRSPADEAAYEALCDQEAALEDLEYEHDPRTYGEALQAVVLAEAACRYPGIPVEVTIDTDERLSPDYSDYWVPGPEKKLTDTAVDTTPLPWSGMTPKEYPAPAGLSIASTERAAGRLPHLRLRKPEAGS
jgi:hypothetical protein